MVPKRWNLSHGMDTEPNSFKYFLSWSCKQRTSDERHCKHESAPSSRDERPPTFLNNIRGINSHKYFELQKKHRKKKAVFGRLLPSAADSSSHLLKIVAPTLKMRWQICIRTGLNSTFVNFVGLTQSPIYSSSGFQIYLVDSLKKKRWTRKEKVN